jgi:hypothetical protein
LGCLCQRCAPTDRDAYEEFRVIWERDRQKPPPPKGSKPSVVRNDV